MDIPKQSATKKGREKGIETKKEIEIQRGFETKRAMGLALMLDTA
jgi:hypothetical protein